MKNNYLSITSKKTSGHLLILGLFLIMIFQLISYGSLYMVLAEIALLFFSILFLYRLSWGLLLFIFIRPSIDRQAEYLSVGLTDDLSFNIAAILGVLVIVFFVLYLIKYFKIFWNLSLKFSWIFFLAVLFLGIFYSIDPLSSIYEFIRALSIFAIFALVFLTVQNKFPIRHILYAILFSAIIPFLFAALQIVFGTGLGTTPGVESRVFGTFSHPSPFALYTLGIAAISFFLIVSEKKKNFWAYVIFVSSVIILISTFTRGAWIALAVFLSIIGAMKAPRFLFGAVVISFILFFSSTTVHDRIEDIYNPPADSSIRWRFQQWENMFDVARDRPVLGHGTGTEAVVHYYKFGPDAGNPYTHNDFLKITVENGLLGLVAFMFLVISCVIFLFIKYYKTQPSQLKDLCLVVLALFLVFMMVSIGDNVFRSTATQWVVWSLMAVCLTVVGDEKSEQGDKE